jgi:hypothetical protein
VAVSGAASPATSSSESGEIVSEATGANTVMMAVPDPAPALAVMVAEPLPTAVTRPVASTVATAGALELQVTVAGSGAPLLATGCPVRVTAAPTMRVALDGVTTT